MPAWHCNSYLSRVHLHGTIIVYDCSMRREQSKGTSKDPWHCSIRVGCGVLGVRAYLTVSSLVWAGGDEIIHGLKRLQCAPVDMLIMTSDLTSLVPPQFMLSYLLQWRENGSRIFYFVYFLFNYLCNYSARCSLCGKIVYRRTTRVLDLS